MSKNPALSLEHLSYNFGTTAAVNDFSLEIEAGTFTTLLGPSGCGKTTLLRLISGFLEPAQGKIKIDGIDQEGIEPNERKIGMVFQDYALFPHLTVRQNLLYGLKLKSKDKIQNEEKVRQLAQILEIENLLTRYPDELSGGQQQRAALGRALVLEPKILLMDEPLSSLDTKLRIQVREELREIQKKLKITTVYVTHDQEEALSLSDKIAVIHDGKLLQAGSPKEIYFHPKDFFTADFVGRANFLRFGDEAKKYLVRPEWIKILPLESDLDFTAKILSSSFLGEKTRYILECQELSADKITADAPTNEDFEYSPGSQVKIEILRKILM